MSFLHTVLYFIEKGFIVTNFTLPRLFRNLAISNCFPFLLGLRNSGVQLYKRRRFRRQKYGMGIGRMSLHVNLEMPKLPVRGPQQIKTRNLE